MEYYQSQTQELKTKLELKKKTIQELEQLGQSLNTELAQCQHKLECEREEKEACLRRLEHVQA